MSALCRWSPRGRAACMWSWAPIEAIKFRMEQQGLTARDLEAYIGPSGRVSEVLNRKRPLSIRMIKQLHEGLRIPYESLLAGVR